MLQSVDVMVEQLPHAAGLPLPAYVTAGSAGLDLTAAIDGSITLAPGERALVPTGLRIAVPPGFEAQVRARSGLSLQRGLGVPNAPGTIDSDYRGEVGVLLINWSDERQTIWRGDRIAQLVVAPVVRVSWAPCEHLPPSDRGSGGFGHSGVQRLETTQDGVKDGGVP